MPQFQLRNINNPPPPRVCFAVNSCMKFCGNLAKIPTMIIIEVPFPKPLSVIFSPSHITNKVPVVRIITVETQKIRSDKQAVMLPGLSFLKIQYKPLPGMLLQ